MDWKQHRTLRAVAASALALGVAGGSYGIASAASTSGASSGSGSSSGTVPALAAQQGTRPQGWGPQRSDEALLTGTTEAKVRAAAVAKEPGATVSRVEADADGHAAYEVHIVRSDGTLVTVYVDRQFDVVAVETGMPAPAGQPAAAGQTTA